ncbi:hypothetical protein [Arsenophonus sp. PmNCSU2021_1]|uniref:hypothetical protein n=1 Tax=Arsenophonus sp. PmNCSU2021_1 TaxID=3118989 RepID=UPI002FF029B1
MWEHPGIGGNSWDFLGLARIYLFDTDEQNMNKNEPIGKIFDTYCNGFNTVLK